MRKLLTLFLVPVLIASGCGKTGGECDLAFNVNQSEIVVTFKDAASGKYLYSQLNPLYNKDSLKVFDPGGNSLVILRVMRAETNPPHVQYWDLSFGNIYDQSTDANSFNAELCKKYVVKYLHNERDTITACFKAKKTECGSVFETLKVYYKGQLVGDGSNTTGISVIINKN